MDKTYVESQNQPAFDWNKALANPPDQYTDEHQDLKLQADDWVTCACGNQCAIIPRYSAGGPRDDTLRHLGLKFSDNIYDADWPAAKQTLSLIESRATLLISAELSKLSTLAKQPNSVG